MISALKNKLSTFVAALALVLIPLAVPAAVSAQANIQGSLCEGTSLEVGAGGDCTVNGEDATTRVNTVIETTVNIFSVIVGVIAVIMIIWAGLRYITSGGDSGKVGNAKNTMVYAIIGLVVVALAQFIVNFVLDQVI